MFSRTVVTIGSLIAVALQFSCGKESKFNSSQEPPPAPAKTNPGPASPAQSAAGASAVSAVRGAGREDLPRTPELCTDKHRAIRLAMVVDNTGSNNETPGVIQSGEGGYRGSDPIKNGDPFGFGNGFTDRQKAIYETILRITELDQTAFGQNDKFLGSELGLTAFPLGGKTAESLAQSKVFSGSSSVLPSLMTSTKTIKITNEFKQDLWNLLKFTHTPEGSTPYKTALEGAAKLLRDTKAPNDPRRDVVLLITDGLPTDSQPSAVKAVRNDLGLQTDVVVLSIYQVGNDTNEQNAAAKNSLFEAWSDSRQWGRRPGASDGFSSFDEYWSALLRLPKEISNEVIDIQGSENLRPAIDKVLEVYAGCK